MKLLTAAFFFLILVEQLIAVPSCRDVTLEIQLNEPIYDIYPQSILERLKIYSPDLYRELKDLKPEDWITSYHGADKHFTEINPVMVNQQNQYFGASGDQALNLAMAYMSGKGKHAEYLSKANPRYRALLKSPFSNFGFLLKLKVPKTSFLYEGAYLHNNSILINDLLFVEQIGVYSLKKLKQINKGQPVNSDKDEAIDWYSPQDFFRDFFGNDREFLKSILNLRRSPSNTNISSELKNIKSKYWTSKLDKTLDKIEGITFTNWEGANGHYNHDAFLNYRDKNKKQGAIHLSNFNSLFVNNRPYNDTIKKLKSLLSPRLRSGLTVKYDIDELFNLYISFED